MRMTLVLAALLLTGCASQPAPSDPTTIAAGAFAYGYRCKGCHEPATPGAPTREEMAAMKPGKIVRTLTTGKMKLLTLDMPESEAKAIAAYLTLKP